MSGNSYDGMYTYAVGVVKWWAWKLKSKGHPYDIEDLEQELICAYELARREHGEELPKDVINVKIKQKAIMLIRETQTDKRKANYNTLSLDTKVSDGEEDMTFIDLMADTGEIKGHHALKDLSEQSIETLAHLEVEEMRASLDDDGRKLFDALREFTIAEIAEAYDVAENTIRNRREKLGNELIKKGFFKKR